MNGKSYAYCIEHNIDCNNNFSLEIKEIKTHN